jgi:hypothetical protein
LRLSQLNGSLSGSTASIADMQSRPVANQVPPISPTLTGGVASNYMEEVLERPRGRELG